MNAEDREDFALFAELEYRNDEDFTSRDFDIAFRAWQGARASQPAPDAEVMRDALRYRWLRGNREAQLPNGCFTDVFDADGSMLFLEELDEAIDAAIAKGGV